LHPQKVIIITGGSGQLGGTMALALADPLTGLLIHYHKEGKKAQEIAKSLLNKESQALCYQADVRSRPQIDSMISFVLSKWNRLDLLIHCAGITKDRSLIRMEEASFDDVIDINLKSAFHCLSAAADPMKNQRDGHVVLIGSIAGHQGRAGQINYAASKAGLIGLMRSAALELAPWNIRVNLILPGFQPSGITRNLSRELSKELEKQNILGRSSSLDDISGFIRWLSKTKNISGQIFNLDSRIFT